MLHPIALRLRGRGLTVNGLFAAPGPKMFVQQHPKDDDKEIYYAALLELLVRAPPLVQPSTGRQAAGN